MPQIDDRARIRAILERDRPWAAYALADLEPGFFEDTRWFVPPGGPPDRAILLHYGAFDVPVYLAFGDAETIAPLIEEAEAPLGGAGERFFVVKHELRPLLEARYRLRDPSAMLRMRLDPAEFVPPARAGEAMPLGMEAIDELRALYADGASTGESPEFFTADMLAQGTYHGVREAGVLAAAAGTHVLAPGIGVGAIGNVYTRRDARGRGLGGCVTGAVAERLVRLDLSTIALNVAEVNQAAIRVYQRLGFRPWCRYLEAPASRM